MVQDGLSPFATALRAVADWLGPLPEEEAQQFLQQWPLEAVFRCGLGVVRAALAGCISDF